MNKSIEDNEEVCVLGHLKNVVWKVSIAKWGEQ